MPLELRLAYRDLDGIRRLLREYAAELGIDLGFQHYDEEVAGLPGHYALPAGRLYLAWRDEIPAGCVALRPHEQHGAEVKRLFVKPEFRKFGIGRSLMEQILADAKTMKRKYLVLDTLSTLANSVALYRKLGFREIAPYCPNPSPDALFFRLDLNKTNMDS